MRFILKGREYDHSKENVERVMKGIIPEPIHKNNKYYTEVKGTKYPPKQVLSILLGLGKVEFTTMDASNILKRLGFTIKSY